MWFYNFSFRLPPGQAGVNHSFSTMQSRTNNTEEVELFNAVALAKKALSASTEAASLAENPKLYGDESDDIISTRYLLLSAYGHVSLLLCCHFVSKFSED